ncbi:MAG: hypothetical protein LLG44_13370 [Chloroflexi bacterium]|nr:hypothetical protein [Chloroflexota bacterium]
MFKKQVAFIFVIVALALVLCSCTFTPGELVVPTATTDPNAPTIAPEEVIPTPTPTPLTQKGIVAIINLWHDWQGADAEALTKVLDLFKQEYPNVIINVTYVPTAEMKDKFEGDSRSVYLIIGPNDWAKEWMDIYFIQELTLMAEAETGWMDTWTPEAKAACTVDNMILNTPINAGMTGVDKYSVFYLTDAANYQNKTASWELMKFMTRTDIQQLLVDAGQKTVIQAQ